MKDISQRVLDLRKAMGLTQRAFADLFPISYVTVSRWENGLRTPTPQAMKRIGEMEQELRSKEQ